RARADPAETKPKSASTGSPERLEGRRLLGLGVALRALAVGQHDVVDDERERPVLRVVAVVVVGLQTPGDGELLALTDVAADDALGEAVEGHAVDEQHLALVVLGAVA